MSLVDGDFFVWELVIRSGYLDLRNRLCCVDREFHRFIQQLRLRDFLDIAFTCSKFLTRHVDNQTTEFCFEQASLFAAGLRSTRCRRSFGFLSYEFPCGCPR